MSVLLNMGMPANCDTCCLCACYVREDGTEENYRCTVTMYPIHDFDKRHKYCPLIEIPPHGRLIDADAAAKQGWTISRTYSASPSQMVYEVKTMADEVLPTIIPAEEGE